MESLAVLKALDGRDLPEARRALGLSEERHLVLFFGFIKPYKGVPYLIDAAGFLKKEFGGDLRVLIVGDEVCSACAAARPWSSPFAPRRAASGPACCACSRKPAADGLPRNGPKPSWLRRIFAWW